MRAMTRPRGSTARSTRDALIARLNAANRAMLETVDAVRLVVGGAASFVGPRQVRVTAGEDDLLIRRATRRLLARQLAAPQEGTA